jgi:hypothetical protein
MRGSFTPVVARSADSSAPWLNPVGLPQAGTQLSGSVSTYMLTTITPRFLPGTAIRPARQGVIHQPRRMLHDGVGTDFSPVPADDHVAFDRVDFWVLTAGASGAIGKLTFALGVNYRLGHSDNLILRNVLSQPIQTHLDIKTVGLTYAIERF